MKKNSSQRDYSKEPNRFTLKMLYNGQMIVTTDRSGRQRRAARDFDYQFREQRFLGNNPINDKVNKKLTKLRILLKNKDLSQDRRDGINYEIECLRKQVIVQDKHNMPHPWERNLFENSWEAVEMGDRLVEIFRLKLKEGTEDYITMTQKFNKAPKLIPEGNYYTLVLVDNQSIRRDVNGQTVNIKKLTSDIDNLQQKVDYNDASGAEIRKLENLKSELKQSRMSREIFRCDFSADDFSYDGKDFTPPLSLIWKDFNVNFRSPNRDVDKSTLKFAETYSFSTIINALSELKRKRSEVLEQIEDAQEGVDNIRIASLEKTLASINAEITSRENIHFKGLRSRIKEYLNLPNYENRFLNPRERNNNFHMNSSEDEITKRAGV